MGEVHVHLTAIVAADGRGHQEGAVLSIGDLVLGDVHAHGLREEGQLQGLTLQGTQVLPEGFVLELHPENGSI